MRTTPASRSSGRPALRKRSGVPEPVARAIETHLSVREQRRDRLFERARALRRRAQGLGIQLHRGTARAADLRLLRRELRSLAHEIRHDSPEEAPLVRDSLQEAVEGALLAAIVRGEPLPGPRELGVDPEPYLLGLGDVVGEVRRLALASLVRDDVESAVEELGLMEDLYETLMRFDTTRAIVPLKPKQDAARALLDRTRGEVVMARVHARGRLPRPARVTEEA